MDNKFLLYIDILGFANLVQKNPHVIAELDLILDSLNVHQHDVFETIVFSDTILVYNKVDSNTQNDNEYMVMYLCEFVQDLFYRLVGKEVYFRAVIKRGQFSHYNLKNIERYHGKVLVEAYLTEKKIKSMGLFIDKECQKYNKVFLVEPYVEDLLFVYLNQSLEWVYRSSGRRFPIDDKSIFKEIDICSFIADIRFFEDIFLKKSIHPDAEVRLKFLNAWNFYWIKYSEILWLLEQSNFSLDSICGKYDWSKHKEYIDSLN